MESGLFGISAGTVAEVIAPPAVTPLPGTPEWLLGIANLRGDIISVVDLQKLWGKNCESQSSRLKLVVLNVKNPDSLIAFTVDKFSEIITLSADQIEPVKDQNFPYIWGKATHNSGILNLLDTEEIFSKLLIGS